MELYHATPPVVKTGPSFPWSMGALISRVAAGGIFLATHGWSELKAGWQHIWEETPWKLVDHVSEFGLPFAEILAPGLVLTATVGAVFLLPGLLTRLGAILLLFTSTTWAIACIQLGNWQLAETATLYAFLSTALLFLGPGAFSLDYLLTLKKAVPKKRPLAPLT